MINWQFIARDFTINSDLDWERNVVPKMRDTDHCYPLYSKAHDIIGWLILPG